MALKKENKGKKLPLKPIKQGRRINMTSSNHKNINHDNRSIAENNGDIYLTIGFLYDRYILRIIHRTVAEFKVVGSLMLL